MAIRLDPRSHLARAEVVKVCNVLLEHAAEVRLAQALAADFAGIVPCPSARPSLSHANRVDDLQINM